MMKEKGREAGADGGSGDREGQALVRFAPECCRLVLALLLNDKCPSH